MKIRKTFAGNLPDNKIVNSNSTSETDTYSCKYLNERNVIVSSEEPTTGEEVWIQKGNNLIDLSLFETKTVNDVTFTNKGNGTITINGTATGDFGINLIKLHLKAGNYSFNSNSNENMYLYDYDNNTNILSSGGNATFNHDYNNVGLDMYIERGTAFSNVLVSPMLNMGSQLPFEKYIDKKIYVQNDNGVYEEFYNEEEHKEFILFDGEPTTGEVSLKDSVSRYKYIEVFYYTYPSTFSSVKVPSSAANISCVIVDFDLAYSTNLGFVQHFKRLQNENTKLIVNGAGRFYKYQGDSNITQDTKNQIYVSKVVGYK